MKSENIRQRQTRLRAAAARTWRRLVMQSADGRPVDSTQLLEAAAALQLDDAAQAFEDDTAAWSDVIRLRAEVDRAEQAHVAACEADGLIDAEINALRARLEHLVHHTGRSALGAAYALGDAERRLTAAMGQCGRVSFDPALDDAAVVSAALPQTQRREPAMAAASWE